MVLRKWLFSDSLHCLTRAGSVLGMGPADRPFLWPPLAGGVGAPLPQALSLKKCRGRHNMKHNGLFQHIRM